MSSFDSKSILTIIGTYQIDSDNNNITSHNVDDDILTIIYNNSFYQATIDTIPSDNGVNNFSVITEVPSFDSTKITAILRTTLGISGEEKEVLLEYSQPIPQPENFLDEISELSLSFQYNESNLQHGCIYPEYPSYDCNARLDDNSCSDDNFTGCGELMINDELVCTCDNERCHDLCNFCGTDEEWKCGGFYNPSPNILHDDNVCIFEPQPPLISFNTSGNLDNMSITDWRVRPDFAVRVNTGDNDDLNSFDTLSFEIHKAVLPINQNNIFNLITGTDPGHTINILDQGSISKVVIVFDDLFAGTFTLNLTYDDLVTWKICLNNILFSKNGNPIKHQYDKSCIELNSDININPVNLDGNFDYLDQRYDKLGRLFQPASGYGILSNDNISIQSDEPGKLYNQQIQLHRGINEISLFVNNNGNYTDALDEYFPIKLILDNPIIERIETFNGFIYRDDTGEWQPGDLTIYYPSNPWDVIDASPTLTGYPYGVALEFAEIRTGLAVPYTITVCSDSSIARGVVECYENGNLNDSFNIEYVGYLSTEPIRLEYKDNNINTPRLRHKEDTAEYGAVASNLWSPDMYTLNIGLVAQCKESLYDDINTLLSFEDDIPVYVQGPNDTDDMGLQGRFIDLIQYETELITHVDMNFDCEYDDNGIVTDGRCYDTWLGTLTTLELGNGYSLNMNDDSFIAGSGDLQNIHPFINMYYDFCGICSGGSTLHEPNSDTDDNAFCINNQCYGGVTHSQDCFIDGQNDDICFGNCCLYPDEIIDWYEEIPEYEIGKGKSFGKKLRLCDTLDEYSTHRCPNDKKEYPTAKFCNSNCNEDCTQINYYKEFDNCKGVLDCLGKCNPSPNQLATYDRFGTCCMIGNIDECGVCYGDSTSCDADCDFDFTPSVNIVFKITTIQQSANTNSGTIRTSLNLGSARVSEIVIPIHKELKITNVYFDNANDTLIDNFDLFYISVLLDQNKILISSIEDFALLSTTTSYDIPITIEFKIDLPNSAPEVDDALNFNNFCIDLPEVYRLDSLLSTTVESELLDEAYCFNDNLIFIYGCSDGQDATNYDFYCGIENINCMGTGICEYQGCFGDVSTDLNEVSQLDDCGVCEGNNEDKDCLYICNGNAELDECGICNGNGIPAGECNCDGAVLDCANVCGGIASIDNCGVCNGDNTTCSGCMDSTACNYNPLAVVSTGDCIYKSIYYLDADSDGLGCETTGIELCPDNPIIGNGYVSNSNGTDFDENCLCNGTFDQCGVCNGTNECVGCTDSNAENYDLTADIPCNSTGNHEDDNNCCIYLEDILTPFLESNSGGTEISGYGTDSYSIFIYEDGYSYVDPEADNLDWLESFYANGLDDWLLENTGNQTTADTNLVNFLEEYGGVQIEYPNIYIKEVTPGSSEKILISYPFQDDFMNSNFLDILNNSYYELDGTTPKDFTFFDTINIYYSGEGTSNWIINLLFTGEWVVALDTETYLIDNSYTLPGGAGIWLIFNQTGIIRWTLE